MAWNLPPVQAAVQALGYPTNNDYGGETLRYCVNPTEKIPTTTADQIWLECDLFAGASGGPWITGQQQPGSGLGTLISVVSDAISTGFIKAPYLGDWFGTFYDKVRDRGVPSIFVPAGQLETPQGQPLTTSLQVQNLGPYDTRTVMVWTNENGGIAKTLLQVIPGSGSVTVTNQGPAGCVCALEIVPVGDVEGELAVVTNHVDQRGMASTLGTPAGSSKLYLPLLMRGNNGWDTWFVLQNTTKARLTGTLAFKEGSTLITSDRVDLQPGAAVRLDQGGRDGFPKVYSAELTVDGDGRATATVFETAPDGLLSYNAFGTTAPGTALAAPLIMANNSGASTGVQVQNTGAGPATITVSYTPNTAKERDGIKPCAVQPEPIATPQEVAPGASWTFQQLAEPQFKGCGYIGSALITASEPLVAVVNQAGAGASAYEAFNASQLRGVARVPLLQANNGPGGTIFSGIQVQNPSGVQATVSVDYGGNSVPSDCGDHDHDVPVPAGASATVLQPTDFGTCRYVGSAVLTERGGRGLAVLVNQTGARLTDPLSTYVGW